MESMHGGYYSDTGISCTMMLLFSAISATLLLTCLVLQDLIVSFSSGYVCATVFVYPFICMLLDIVAEIYGYRISRQVLWFTILSTILFSAVIMLMVQIPNPTFATLYAQKFSVVTAQLLRNSLVGGISILIGQTINIYILTKFKRLLNGRYFALRSIGSTFVGDTITFVIALFGFFVHTHIVNTHQLFVITVDELMIMYSAAFILSLPGNMVVVILKKYVNKFDSETVMVNPFAKNN